MLTTPALVIVMFTAGSIRYEGFASAQVVLNILVTINDPGFVRVAQGTIRFGDTFIIPGVVVALVAVLIGAFVLHYTRLGRNVYAIGGSEQSALLMGVRVGRTKIVIGLLLPAFILLQRLVFARGPRRRRHARVS